MTNVIYGKYLLKKIAFTQKSALKVHTHTHGNYDHLPCQKRRKENENDIITQFPDDKSLQISQCYWYWSFSMSIGMDWM